MESSTVQEFYPIAESIESSASWRSISHVTEEALDSTQSCSLGKDLTEVLNEWAKLLAASNSQSDSTCPRFPEFEMPDFKPICPGNEYMDVSAFAEGTRTEKHNNGHVNIQEYFSSASEGFSLMSGQTQTAEFSSCTQGEQIQETLQEDNQITSQTEGFSFTSESMLNSPNDAISMCDRFRIHHTPSPSLSPDSSNYSSLYDSGYSSPSQYSTTNNLSPFTITSSSPQQLNNKDQSSSSVEEVERSASTEEETLEGKPTQSFVEIIGKTLLSFPSHRALLGDIYSQVAEKYPYFGKNKSSSAWKNSIRHNLSINECFIKDGRPQKVPRGSYWAIHPACKEDFMKGIFSRRNARVKIQDYMKKQISAASEMRKMAALYGTRYTTGTPRQDTRYQSHHTTGYQPNYCSTPIEGQRSMPMVNSNDLSSQTAESLNYNLERHLHGYSASPVHLSLGCQSNGFQSPVNSPTATGYLSGLQNKSFSDYQRWYSPLQSTSASSVNHQKQVTGNDMVTNAALSLGNIH